MAYKNKRTGIVGYLVTGLKLAVVNLLTLILIGVLYFLISFMFLRGTTGDTWSMLVLVIFIPIELIVQGYFASRIWKWN